MNILSVIITLRSGSIFLMFAITKVYFKDMHNYVVQKNENGCVNEPLCCFTFHTNKSPMSSNTTIGYLLSKS